MWWLRHGKRTCLFFPAAKHFHPTGWSPAVDVYRTRRGWIAKFELAGVRLEDLRVEVHSRYLTVRGVRRDCSVEEGCHYHSLEIAYSHFERSVEFPADLARASITTEYQAGMLLVRIQTEGDRP